MLPLVVRGARREPASRGFLQAELSQRSFSFFRRRRHLTEVHLFHRPMSQGSSAIPPGGLECRDGVAGTGDVRTKETGETRPIRLGSPRAKECWSGQVHCWNLRKGGLEGEQDPGRA